MGDGGRHRAGAGRSDGHAVETGEPEGRAGRLHVDGQRDGRPVHRLSPPGDAGARRDGSSRSAGNRIGEGRCGGPGKDRAESPHRHPLGRSSRRPRHGHPPAGRDVRFHRSRGDHPGARHPAQSTHKPAQPVARRRRSAGPHYRSGRPLGGPERPHRRGARPGIRGIRNGPRGGQAGRFRNDLVWPRGTEGRTGGPGGGETRRLRAVAGRIAVSPGRRGSVRKRDLPGDPGGRGRPVEDQGPGHRPGPGHGRRAPHAAEVAQRIQRVGLQAEGRTGRARCGPHGDPRGQKDPRPGLQPDHPVERRAGHIGGTPGGEHRVRSPHLSALPVRYERRGGPDDAGAAAPGRYTQSPLQRPSRTGRPRIQDGRALRGNVGRL